MINANIWSNTAVETCSEDSASGHRCDAVGTGQKSIVELFLTSEPEVTKNAGPVSDIAEAVSHFFITILKLLR
jgi:hypothetical protein